MSHNLTKTNAQSVSRVLKLGGVTTQPDRRREGVRCTRSAMGEVAVSIDIDTPGARARMLTDVTDILTAAGYAWEPSSVMPGSTVYVQGKKQSNHNRKENDMSHNDNEQPQQRGTLDGCDHCGSRSHIAEYHHEGVHGEGPIYIVYCDQNNPDDLADFYTTERVVFAGGERVEQHGADKTADELGLSSHRRELSLPPSVVHVPSKLRCAWCGEPPRGEPGEFDVVAGEWMHDGCGESAAAAAARRREDVEAAADAYGPQLDGADVPQGEAPASRESLDYMRRLRDMLDRTIQLAEHVESDLPNITDDDNAVGTALDMLADDVHEDDPDPAGRVYELTEDEFLAFVAFVRMPQAEVIAQQIAATLRGEQRGRSAVVNDVDVARARLMARSLGADATTTTPDAQFGLSVVSVWTDEDDD